MIDKSVASEDKSLLSGKLFYFVWVNIDWVDVEAMNSLFVLNNETPTPIIDMKTAALNDKRSLFTAEFVTSYL